MRGKRNERILHVGKPGLIPAYAGKTAQELAERGAMTAHPRVCGENP